MVNAISRNAKKIVDASNELQRLQEYETRMQMKLVAIRARIEVLQGAIDADISALKAKQ